ncbi:MAG: tRNA uracil 4-sulfurtransferase ThiI [Methanothrix sp.]|uniref:tRNA uracil 4-sulfurtransferase ThiI n=1 Tax=Methanothrix sp. TaxID=90426 RepID=UPI0032AF5274|nr:tRNA uracil 4-sulfurtransferase ThiI [Methanothrix sp.]
MVRYGEVALKDSWTRSSWERLLRANISHDLRAACIDFRMTGEGGRIYVHTADERAPSTISRVFGVVSVSPAYSVHPRITDISELAVSIALMRSPKSFAIRSRRAGGEISSERIAVEVGAAVQRATGADVDLDNPELEIFVEARPERALVFTEIMRGVGGLPLGSQSRMLALISGGIDSPVAAWLIMRRGSPVSLLHFDASPYADSREQVIRQAEILQSWMSGRRLDLVIVRNARAIDVISSRYPRETCVLCRRLMYHVSSVVMKRMRAKGIVTGYSLGQVASQTPENIMAEQVGIEAPVYHPLIAMDKTEIMDLARRIGTYDVSTGSKQCRAAPRKPVTKAKLDEILRIEGELALRELAMELADEMEVVRVRKQEVSHEDAD